MDILEAFKLCDKEYKINITGDYENPLFQANQIGDILELTNIRATIKDFDEDEKIIKQTITSGGLQNVLFLTEFGLYRLLGISRKPIAKLFRKWVCDVIKSIRLTGKYELEKKNSQIDKILLESKSKIEFERHKTLLSSFLNKRVIYFGKLKIYDDTKFIIKLGYTDGIDDRLRALKTHFGDCMFFDVYECDQNNEFELFLKRHPEIKKYNYREDIKENIKSSETYLVTQEEYNKIQKIVKQNISYYQGFNQDKYIEIERLKVEKLNIELKNNILEKYPNNPELILQILGKPEEDKSDPEEEIESEPKEEVKPIKNYPSEYIEKDGNFPKVNTRNRKVQQYDSNTFELLKTFEGLQDVVRTYTYMSAGTVKTAATKNTIYYGSRWFFIERSAADIKYEIPPTFEIQSSVAKPVALLNKEKTQIEKVFVSQAEASRCLNIKKKYTVSVALKSKNPVYGIYYFEYFEECSEKLRNDFIANGGTIDKPEFSASKKIAQIDINTKQVIKIHTSIESMKKEFCMSRATITKACETGEPKKNYIWKYVD
jgi:prophage antirepressor-like protein